LIQEAEFMAMSPEGVAAVLKERAGKPRGFLSAIADCDTEVALLSRNEPLINLSLARYGLHVETLAKLFWPAEPASPVRLACLANHAVGTALFSGHPFPVGLFGGNVEQMAEWLAQARSQELAALFENPSLDDSFLTDLLRRKDGWEGLSEERLCQIALLLHRNPRMRTPRKDDWMDGYAEYRYAAVFGAAWAMAESVKPTMAFASALGWLYEELETDTHSVKDPLAVAVRWQAADVGEAAVKREAEENGRGSLSDFQRVRKGLAKLALSEDANLLPKLLASDDLALRCCGYRMGRLTAKQILDARDRDGEMAVEELLRNKQLWQTAEQREALHDAAWKVVEADKSSDLMAANLFQSMERDMQAKHPDWFKEDAEPPDPANATATWPNIATLWGNIATLSERLDQQSQTSNQIQQALGRLSGHAEWIWWFALGALAATLLHQ
jgi:hypothetical protein